MPSQFKDIKDEIRELRIIKNDYIGCIKKCKEFISVLNKSETETVKNEKWFVYHNLALNNKKLGNYKLAIKYELVAINYTTKTINDYDYMYVYSIWLIATCHEFLNNSKEAIKLYSECSRFYRKIKDEQQRVCTIWNKAKLLENDKAMLKLIKIYENKNLKATIKTHGDLEYDDVLTEMYTDLLNLYLVENRRDKAFELLYIIKSKNVRKELAKKLMVA